MFSETVISDMDEKDWDRVMTENVKGVFTICRASAAVFKDQQSGRIITLGSESGLIGNAISAHSSAAAAIAGHFIDTREI